jgi:ElaB/YqjD/DUF883 family membrane-anchored ribosome-binding protein
MGQRADEVGRGHERERSESETYVVRPGETRFVSAEGTEAGRTIDAQPVAERHEDDIPEAEEIRAEMEATRAEMSQTIDAIQEKLAPEELKEQAVDVAKDVAEQVTAHVREAIQDATENAKQAVRQATIGRAEDLVYTTRDGAREVTFNMMDTIRENPLPAAIVGIGLGWLLMNSSKRGRRYEAESYPTYERGSRTYGSTYRRNTAYTYPGSYNRYEGYGGYGRGAEYAGYNSGYDEREQEGNGHGVKGRVAEAAGEVQHRAERVMDEASEMASNVASSASDVASNATDMMGHAGERAMDAGTGMWDTIRRNPIPAALAGIGLGWLFMNASHEDEERRWGFAGTYQDRVRYGYGRDYGSPSYAYDYDYGSRGYESSDEGMVGRVTGRVSDAADEARSRVSDVADEARSRVGELGSQVTDQAGEVADQAQYYVERAQGQVERMVQDNPLALGAVAVAVGAAIGMALPGTYREREMMGDAREKFMERAQGVVQQATEKVQRVAEEAGSAAQEAAKKEAKDQGLTGQQSSGSTSGSTSGSSGMSGTSGSTSGTSGSPSTSGTSGSSYATSGTGSTPGSTTTGRPGSSGGTSHS